MIEGLTERQRMIRTQHCAPRGLLDCGRPKWVNRQRCGCSP